MNNAKIKSFHDLEIWNLSNQFVLDIYSKTENFPRKEEFRLTSQLIRSACSVPANIAEGMGRYSRKELIQFLIIARGSAEEVKYHLILARDLSYLSNESFHTLNEKIILIGRKINSLITSLKAKSTGK